MLSSRAITGRGRTATALLAAALLTGGTWLAAGCGEGDPPATGRPVIVASIHPLADLAAQVAGPDIEVQTLLAPGASPHGFEITADRMRLLGRADVLLVVGLNLDPWAEQAASRAGRPTRVLRMAEMVERDTVEAVTHDDDDDAGHDHDHAGHDHDHGGPDSHLWLDPVLTRQWVRNLRDELVSALPEHAATIERNAEAVLASLANLDTTFHEQLADVPKKQMVTFHNAFDRMARRYGLEVVAHLTEVELEHGAEVRPDRWRQAVAAVQRYDLKVIYAEPQFPMRDIDSLRRQAGVEVLKLDPMGHPRREGYGTYQEMMRSNLAALVEGQSRTH